MLNSKSLGVSGYEIFQSSGASYSLTFSGKEIKTKEMASESGYGIRVLKNKKIGFSFCENSSKINEAAKRAVSLSRYSPETCFAFAKKSRLAKLKTEDEKVSTLDSIQLKEIMDTIKDSLEKHAKKSRIVLSSGYEQVSLNNSEGFSGNYTSSSISIYAEGMKEDGFGFAYYEGISMPKDFSEFGEKAGLMAKEMKDAKKLKKGLYNVLFSQSALDELLNVMLPSFSGDWIRKKTSTLYDKVGKKEFCNDLTLIDNGLSYASETRPFDDEGVVSKKRALIENGIVKNFIYDKENAALAKVKKDGFCNRAHFSSSPGAGTSNLLISPGEYTNLEEEINDPLVVHSLHGSHTANATTGDFALEVNVAFHKGRPVRGFMLSANIFKLLKQKILLEKNAVVYGNMISPRIAFSDMMVIS